MRCLILPLVLLAACAPRYEDDIAPPPGGDPDAGCTELGAFQIAAPQPELHYAPTMDVVIDETELQGLLTLTMIDDLGNSYQYTSDTYGQYPTDGGIWWDQDRYHYELAPSHRYTLSVTPQICSAYRTQTVEFFTSAN